MYKAITTDMIDSGVAASLLHENPRDMVKAIYETMCNTKQKNAIALYWSESRSEE